MDDELRKQLLRDELERRSKGKKIVPARYRQKYPDSAEREYEILMNIMDSIWNF